MKRYVSINLRWWLPILVLSAFAVMMAATLAWRYQYETAQLEQRTDELVKARMVNLQHRIEGLLRLNQAEMIAEEIADFGSSLEVNSLALVDEHGQVLFATRRIWLGKAIAESMPGFDARRFASVQQHGFLALILDAQRDRLIAYQPLSLAARPGEIRPSRGGMLLLDYSLASAKADIQREMLVRAAGNLIIGVIAMMLLMLALQRWLSRPLNYLRAAVQGISQGDFKTRIDIGGSGELAELGAAVSKMQNDLARAQEQTSGLIQTLSAHKRDLQKITDALPGPISRLDPAGHYLFASAAHERWFGQPPAKVLGQAQHAVIGAELYALYEPHIKRALAGEQVIFEAGIANPGGGMRDAMITMLPDFDSSGVVCGYYTVGVDITERKRAEERFRYAVEAAPNAMIMTDAQGIIQLVNSRTSTMFGYTEDELLGQHINLLLPKSVRAVHVAHVEGFRAHPSGRQMGTGRDLFGQHKDGGQIPVEVGLNPLQTSEGLFVIASVVDITERKLVMEKLQEKNVELERYTHMVSHDLKSPLVTIKTFLGYLKQDMAQGDSARIETDMGFMSKAADKMGQLLDELLEMSRIGRIVSLPVHVSWRDVVQEALDINAGAIAQSGVVVTVEDADITLFGERPRLVQIWQNLIDNAVKFLGDQAAPQIHIGMEQNEHGTVFFVRDNGIGVDIRYRDKIFGMFEKLDAQAPGSGLGLALVKRIVQLYRGEIGIDSKGVGHGACIRFTLPQALKSGEPGVSS
mgnify:CR=1 FL=1